MGSVLLPDVLLQEICMFLTLFDIIKLSEVSVFHQEFVNSDDRLHLIQNHLARDFGVLSIRIGTESNDKGKSLLSQATRFYYDWYFVQNLFKLSKSHLSNFDKLALLKSTGKNGCVEWWFDRV